MGASGIELVSRPRWTSGVDWVPRPFLPLAVEDRIGHEYLERKDRIVQGRARVMVIFFEANRPPNVHSLMHFNLKLKYILQWYNENGGEPLTKN